MLPSSLSSLPLSERHHAHLRRVDLQTTAELLLTPTSELASSLRLPTHELAALQREAAINLAPCARSVADLLGGDVELEDDSAVTGRGNEAVCSTGDFALDEMLGGGVYKGALTEIVGESSTGKTQLFLQTAVYHAFGFGALPDVTQPAGGVAMLTSGGDAAASSLVRRFTEIAEFAMLSHSIAAEDMEDRLEQALRNVHIACVADFEALEHAVSYTLPGLVARAQQGDAPGQAPTLIIIDDFPAIFQEDASRSVGSIVQKSRDIADLADKLKRLAAPGRAVIVVNHVTDTFDNERQFASSSADATSNGPASHAAPLHYVTQSAFYSGSGTGKTPSLGQSWVNSINVRILLHFDAERRRWIKTLLNPFASTQAAPLVVEIRKEGLRTRGDVVNSGQVGDGGVAGPGAAEGAAAGQGDAAVGNALAEDESMAINQT